MKTDVIKLYRPVGQIEMDLIKASDYKKFPPRLYWQPIFYPVLDHDYACTIAREWNTKDEANGSVGYVTEFSIPVEYFQKFEVQNVGAHNHNELWVPAEELENFNANIIRGIKVIDAYYGKNFIGEKYL
ncbi:MAG: ADP-ribosylation/crystallin J1 [Bacteroidia bacterium]